MYRRARTRSVPAIPAWKSASKRRNAGFFAPVEMLSPAREFGLFYGRHVSSAELSHAV
jgi:hypothetical protein